MEEQDKIETPDEGQVGQANEQEAQNSFDAGFSKVRASLTGEAPAEDKPAEETTPEATPETALFAGFKEEEVKVLFEKAGKYDELKADLESQTSKIHGKIGELNRKIISQAQGPREIKPEDLSETSGYLPELADVIAKDLSKLVLGGNSGKGIDEAAVEALVSARIEKVMFDREHKGWEQMVNTPEWSEWLSEQVPEVVKELSASNDYGYVGSKLNEFKGWQEKKKIPEPDPEKKNEKRLEAAIAPKTAGPEAKPKKLDDNAAFAAGFNAVKKRRLGN